MSHSWYAGSLLYRAMGRFDGVFAARRWQPALDWLLDVSRDRPIAEVQFWGHGKWGGAMVGCEAVSAAALKESHAFYPSLAGLRERMSGPDALWWFRTCETFGADKGQRFARAWTRFFGCRAAGHTYIIGAWQSGLHLLHADAEPDWSNAEGLAAGNAAAPLKALWSGPLQPNTVSCLRGNVPSYY